MFYCIHLMKEKEILAILCGDAQPELRDMAWRTLYNHTHDRIIGIMRQYYGTSLKSDVFEDVYADACIDLIENARKGKISSDGSHANLPGYLYTICMRKCRRLSPTNTGKKAGEGDDGKKATVRRLVSIERQGDSGRELIEMIADPSETDGLSPEDREYLLNLLLRALESLPENCRKIFRQFYWEKKTMAEIALMLGLRGPDSAKTTKNRCMDKYRKLVEAFVKDDKVADEIIRDTVERDSLKALFSEFRDRTFVNAALCDAEDSKLLPDDVDWDAELPLD